MIFKNSLGFNVLSSLMSLYRTSNTSQCGTKNFQISKAFSLKVRYVFFHKIKDTFFIFTNTFIDLDILSMPATCCYWLLVGRG